MGILFLGVLMAALDIAIVATTLSSIQADLGIDERSVAWLLSVFVLCNLIGLPLMARLSDRYGRRTIYLLDVGLFAVGASLVIAAPSLAVLLFGRALQGFGASGIFPVASAVVGDVYPPERRGRQLGLIGAVFGLAFIIGPIVGGILVSFGWRWPFVVSLTMALLVGVLSWARLPNTRSNYTTGRLDWPGMLVLALLLGSLAFGLNQLDTSNIWASLMSLSVAPFLVLALGLIPVFYVVERKAEAPLLRLGLVQRRQVQLASTFAIGAGVAEAAFVFMADYAGAAFNLEARAASFTLLPLVLAIALGAPVGGRLLDRVGSRYIIGGGVALMTAGMLVLGLAAPVQANYYLGSVLIGIGLSGLLGSSLSYILLNEAEATERTVAQGIVTLFISVGQLIGAALIGAIAASGVTAIAGYRSAFVLIAGFCGVLAVLAFALKNQRRERAEAVS
ncbi:MAG: MFS transporter [Rhodothermales bacterium]